MRTGNCPAIVRSGTCLALAAAAMAFAPASAGATHHDRRTISVTGTATLTVPNDLATFRFGVQTRRRTASAALSATAIRVRRVLARLGAEGIAPADITTDEIRVERVSRPLRPGSRVMVVEYVATSGLRVQVRDVASAGRVATAAVAAGATSVSGPTFTASDPSATARLALVVAYQDARDKAARLADAAGVDLEDPVSIREGVEVAPQTVDQEGAQAPADEGRPRVPPPVRPGTSTVTATVTATFEID